MKLHTIRSRTSLVILLLGAALGACTDFDPGSRVTDFRLLAIAADKPYAAPGETVKLEALYHEPFGRPITWAWSTCPLPRDSTATACLARFAELSQSPDRAPSFTVGREQTTYEVTIPPNILDGIQPQSLANATVGVLTIGCPGELSPRDPRVVPTGELPFECREAGSAQVLPFERYVVSVKRIYLYPRDKNQNPTITSVTWDGAPWPSGEVKEVNACDFDSNQWDDCKGEKHELVVTAPPESVEAGTSEYGTPFREAIVYQFYATEGLFEFNTKTFESPKTRWSARTRARGQTVDFWMVVRDNRGGVSWTTRQVKVR